MPEFKGAIYDDAPAVSGNRKAEVALVHLMLTADGMCEELFDRVESRDFCYDDCRFVFEQARAMRIAKHPVADKAAQASWFKRPEVIQAMRAHKLDSWFDCGTNQPLPATSILELLIDGEFATVAHLDFYVLEVRKWRVIRGLRILALDLSENIDEHEPQEVIEWLEEKLSQLKEVAAPLLQPPNPLVDQLKKLSEPC